MKTSKLKVFNIALLLIISFSSCRKERLLSKVDTEDVFCIFKAEYYPETDKTKFIAKFRCKKEKGDYIKLNENATVNCNGLLLIYDESDHSYVLEQSGIADSVIFNWTDLDGNNYSNAIQMPDSINYSLEADTTDLFPASYNLIWRGNPIIFDDESVAIYVNGGENNEYGKFTRIYGDGRTFRQSTLNATSISCNLSTERDSRVQLQRERKRNLQQGTTAGGYIVSYYIPSYRKWAAR
jgi:hypothetical protein